MVSFDEEHLDTLERLKKIVSESSGIVVNGDIIIEDKGGNIKKDVQKIRITCNGKFLNLGFIGFLMFFLIIFL